MSSFCSLLEILLVPKENHILSVPTATVILPNSMISKTLKVIARREIPPTVKCSKAWVVILVVIQVANTVLLQILSVTVQVAANRELPVMVNLF